VVIELLEGKPPYHFLNPMPALFRIVQDDCPPIPEGASPIVKDFLYHCFQKDANLRISAKKLLRHPLMVQARKQLEAQQGTPSATDGRRPRSNYNFDDAVLKVQEWNEALRCTCFYLFQRPPVTPPQPPRDLPEIPYEVAQDHTTGLPPHIPPPNQFSQQGPPMLSRLQPLVVRSRLSPCSVHGRPGRCLPQTRNLLFLIRFVNRYLSTLRSSHRRSRPTTGTTILKRVYP